MHTTAHKTHFGRGIGVRTTVAIICAGMVILSGISAMSAHAHPGGTDKNGCHTCRKNCSKHGLSDGERHCHTSGSTKQSQETATSTAGNKKNTKQSVPSTGTTTKTVAVTKTSSKTACTPTPAQYRVWLRQLLSTRSGTDYLLSIITAATSKQKYRTVHR